EGADLPGGDADGGGVRPLGGGVEAGGVYPPECPRDPGAGAVRGRGGGGGVSLRIAATAWAVLTLAVAGRVTVARPGRTRSCPSTWPPRGGSSERNPSTNRCRAWTSTATRRGSRRRL